jgi:hypothetical protein
MLGRTVKRVANGFNRVKSVADSASVIASGTGRRRPDRTSFSRFAFAPPKLPAPNSNPCNKFTRPQ